MQFSIYRTVFQFTEMWIRRLLAFPGIKIPASNHSHALDLPHRHSAVSCKLLCKLCKGAQISRLSGSLIHPILRLRSRKKVPRHEGSNLKERSSPQSCPLGLRRTQVKLAGETDTSPGDRSLLRGGGGGGGAPLPQDLRTRVLSTGPLHPPPGPLARRPPQTLPARPLHPSAPPHPAPANLPITPAEPHDPGSRGHSDGPAQVPRA